VALGLVGLGLGLGLVKKRAFLAVVWIAPDVFLGIITGTEVF
jgi:hypothetical protein